MMKQEKLLATKEAIHRRRSIRKFKPDPVPDECITALLNPPGWLRQDATTISSWSRCCRWAILKSYPRLEKGFHLKLCLLTDKLLI